VSPVLVIARYAIQEAVRRRVFTVVLALTAAFVALYGLAVWQVFRRIGDIRPPGGIEPKPFAGATIFGLSMFATMFLGVVLGSANVVGGFVVTDRMLEMFKKREPPKAPDAGSDDGTSAG